LVSQSHLHHRPDQETRPLRDTICVACRVIGEVMNLGVSVSKRPGFEVAQPDAVSFKRASMRLVMNELSACCWI
jgi:hypothetical protein